MGYRIAAVSFLNALPLIEWFGEESPSQHKVLSALPSELSGVLARGEADVALLPIVEAFRGHSGGILSGTGIACRGRVDSVKVFSNSPLDKVDLVFADRGSRSSVALLKVLLGEVFGITPVFEEVEPKLEFLPQRNQAILVIGDRCFEYERHLRYSGLTCNKGHDLGEMWLELTGFPFVFAAWSLAPQYLGNGGEEGAEKLGQLLNSARDFGMDKIGDIAEREASRGRLGYHGEATTKAIEYYFKKSLVYRLGKEELAGMRRFHELCLKYKLVPDFPMPPII